VQGRRVTLLPLALTASPDEMRISPSVAAILASQPVVPRRSMAVLCPKAATNPDALSLLDKLLVHSPRNRLTAEQVRLVCAWPACERQQ
jgi:hypothetical protein